MIFIDTTLFKWVLLPIIIFLARILDVSIGTVRIIAISKGIRKIAVILAFFEIFLWLIVITQVLSNLSNPVQYIAYAAGFATGTYMGMLIEKKLSLGNILIRIITAKGGTELAEFLRNNGYRVTDLDAQSNEGHIRIIFLVVKRKLLENIASTIKQFNPDAFYTIEDVRFISEDNGLKQLIPAVSAYGKTRKGK